MLISQDRLEACCCRNEGEHACAVEKLRVVNAVSTTCALPPIPPVSLSTLLCMIAISSAADYRARLGATSLQEPQHAVRQVDLLWLERSGAARRGAPLIYLSLSPQSHCT